MTARRLPAIDWMRGLVMVLMAIDHASEAFNRGRFSADAARWFDPSRDVPGTAQLITRQISHLCAPTFLFLAGTALALSIHRRVAKGTPAWDIDRYLLLRGGFILLLDPLWISRTTVNHPIPILQVLFAIGASLMLMAPLRRLPGWALGLLAAAIIVGGEPAAGLGGPGGVLLFGLGRSGPFFVLYSILPWLAMMLLGWLFGRYLVRGPARPDRLLGVVGLIALGVFAVVRGIDGFGNLGMHRHDDSLSAWLLVSKYPPSVAFTALELGIMSLCLAGFFVVQRHVGDAVGGRDPLLVFGQTPLLFYVVHFPLLVATSKLLGMHRSEGLGETYLAAGLVLVLLYPVCVVYRGYRRANPDSWARYL